MIARLQIGGTPLAVDLSRPVSLALGIDFSDGGPRHFGAPAPQSRPLVAPGFPGEVAAGASCNCRIISFTPHCNGTHTECVGHLTREPLDAWRIVPSGLIPARLISVEPVAAASTGESSTPPPQPGDRLVTRRALEAGWPSDGPFAATAVVIRTVAGGTPGLVRENTQALPPYLTREAVELLVERGIEHVVVDLPSIDRSHDEGRLTGHRVFFGLPPEARSLAQATRPQCTITEFARVPPDVPDGWYLLQLQAPEIGGEAVTSRPLLYALRET